MWRVRLTVCAAAAAGAVTAVAQDDDGAPPALDFLEYLGSWESSDEDWLVVAGEFMALPPVNDTDSPAAVGDESDLAGAADEATSDDDED